ncbi:MAG TPA: transcriptional regulator [Vicinamibacterales bacterium]
MPRYRFSAFILSPRRRLLVRDGRELPLIPRYFDLLVFLVERRHEAVHRRDIFDRVWADVIVSDSALSQAIRTIRRILADDPREPRFIRTVSRHGYRFVCTDVVEEDDDGAWPLATEEKKTASAAELPASGDAFEPLIARLTRTPTSVGDEEDQHEAAELLHALGTSAAIARLGGRPGHAHARAVLRDARWDSPFAGDVPIVGAAAPMAVARALVALRWRRAARMVALRWAGASVGGGLAGAVGGAVGAAILVAVPGSTAPIAVVPVLATVGATCGALGAAGVGAGLCAAEAAIRSRRLSTLVAGGALGGAVVGWAVQEIVRAGLAAVVGLTIGIGGGLEGIAIGAAAGFGYAIATRGVEGGLAAPLGSRRLRVAAIVGATCAVAALVLTLAGRPLVGGTVNAIAHASRGSQVSLAPLGRLIGEPDFGPVSQAVIGAGEGALFGFGLALGLTRRP